MTQTPAQAFARRLRAELVRQQMTVPMLAAESGVPFHTIANWSRGRDLPTVARALPVSEVLMCPEMAEIVTAVRTKTCLLEGCGRVFIDETKGCHQSYCRSRCQGTAYGRRRRAIEAPAKASLNSHRLTLYQETVDRLCRDYCPFVKAGLCPDPECPPQQMGLSPLKLTVEAQQAAA